MEIAAACWTVASGKQPTGGEWPSPVDLSLRNTQTNEAANDWNPARNGRPKCDS
jgi:hypothetical protein